MSNELSVKSGLTYVSGNISVARTKNHSVTVTDGLWSGGTLTLSTDATLIPFELVTASYIWLCNTDATHLIDIHNSAASEDAYGFTSPIITLGPGQTAQFPPGDASATWYAVAQTGTPVLEFFAISE